MSTAGDEVRRAGVLATGVLFSAVLAYFALFVRYGLNIDDEGTLLAQFQRTALGERPYVDFHMGYTPAGHYFHAWLFRAFGTSVVPLRCALALTHALTATLLFAIARRFVSVGFALLPALAYCASMPFYPGEFASFNIPYPAWYCTLAWVAGTWMLIRFLESGRIGWLAATGLVVGLSFAFKPNVGLFQLAGTGLALLVGLEPAARRSARVSGLLWWLLLAGVVAGLIVVFASQASARDLRIYLLPIALLTALLGAQRMVRRREDEPAHGLLAAGLVLGVAFFVVTVPWVAWFLHLLGTERFARQILFIGTGFEQYYYLPFPPPGLRDRMLEIGTMLAIAAGLVARSGVLPTRLLQVGLVVAGFGAVAGVGLARPGALFSGIEEVSFRAVLVANWLALAAALPAIFRRTRTRDDRILLVVVASAFTMYLQLYPRTDYMHVVAAAPMSLVLAAVLASWYCRWLPREGHVRTLAMGAVLGAALVVFGFRMAPRFASVLEWDGGLAWRPMAELGLARAPIVLERGRADRLQQLAATVHLLETSTRPDERIFPFPAIEILCFLSDRLNATRHGYFFPGWPGHEVEAEVTATLAASPPRIVVALYAHQFFFASAPAYYYELRDFVNAHYRRSGAIGEYAILLRRDVPDGEVPIPVLGVPSGLESLEAEYGPALAGTPAERIAAARMLVRERLDVAWPPLTALLDDPDPEVRDAALVALRDVRDPDLGPVIARALEADLVPAARRLQALQMLLAFGDARVLQSLLALLPDLVDRERATVLDGLDAVSRKIVIASYWFGTDPSAVQVPLALEDRPAWRRRLADPEEDQRLRTMLARVLPRLRWDGLAPALDVAIGSGSTDLRTAAAGGLFFAGIDGPDLPLADVLVPLVVRDPILAPALLLRVYRRDPATTRARITEVFGSDAPLDQHALAWVVAAARDPEMEVTLTALAASAHAGVRLPALVGLARLGTPTARAAAERGLADPDVTIRDVLAHVLAAPVDSGLPAAPGPG